MKKADIKHYDYIIAGAGLSGQMLAYFLADSSLKQKKILIIEQNWTHPADRDFSFWIDQSHPFSSAVAHRWTRLAACFDDQSIELSMKRYSFELIHFRSLCSYIKKKLSQHSEFTILEDKVDSIRHHGRTVTVTAGGIQYEGDWVFSSLPPKQKKCGSTMKGCSWQVRLPTPAFDPATMTFCDYRYVVPDLPGFFYVLPTSTTEAVIHYALFSKSATDVSEHELTAHLKSYLSLTRQLNGATVRSQGLAQYPTSDRRLRRKRGSRIVPIGAAAGLVKTSSSFGFTNILRDTQALVHSLETTGDPYYEQPGKWLFRLGDRAMQWMIETKPERTRQLFQSIFTALSTADPLFDFLDERGTMRQHVEIIKSVNPRIFYGN